MQIDDIIGGSRMSKLFIRQIGEHESKESLFSILLDTIKCNQNNCDLAKITKAYEISEKAYDGLYRYSGDEYIIHPLNVAIILAEVGAGENIIIAGLMCDILTKTKISMEKLEGVISYDVLAVLNGVSDFEINCEAENDDIVLVKLAERLHNMRTLRFMDESSWRNKAKETIEIYMPIARKLGNDALMEELNKIALEYV